MASEEDELALAKRQLGQLEKMAPETTRELAQIVAKLHEISTHLTLIFRNISAHGTDVSSLASDLEGFAAYLVKIEKQSDYLYKRLCPGCLPSASRGDF